MLAPKRSVADNLPESPVGAGSASLRRQIEVIKDAVRIEAVAADYGKQRPSGANRLLGRCVSSDHEDKTPSMTIYTDEQRFKCFGCGAHGDVIDLVRLAEPGMETWEAMVYLSTRYGVDLPPRPPSWAARQRRQAPVRTGIEAARMHLARERLYRRFFAPLVEAVEDPEVRVQDEQNLWEATDPLARHIVANMMGGGR